MPVVLCHCLPFEAGRVWLVARVAAPSGAASHFSARPPPPPSFREGSGTQRVVTPSTLFTVIFSGGGFASPYNCCETSSLMGSRFEENKRTEFSRVDSKRTPRVIAWPIDVHRSLSSVRVQLQGTQGRGEEGNRAFSSPGECTDRQVNRDRRRRRPLPLAWWAASTSPRLRRHASEIHGNGLREKPASFPFSSLADNRSFFLSNDSILFWLENSANPWNGKRERERLEAGGAN